MKKSILWAAMAAMALTACNKEEIAAPAEGQNLVYREYTATIADGVSTKVNFGEPADGKISAYFQDGDEIALTDGTNVYKGTVSKPEGEANTLIKTEVPETFALKAAYYPYEAYTLKTDDEGNPVEPQEYEFKVPGRQYAGKIPVLLQSTAIDGENITFSAAEAGSAVIHYSLTGDILLTEVRLHTTNNASLINNNPQYTITYSSQYGSSPVQLSDEPFDVYFVVTAGEAKSLTLEAKTAKPESALGTTSYSYYKRKITPEELKSGAFIDMPTIELNEEELLGGNNIWEFGSAHGGTDYGWTLNTIEKGGSIDCTSNKEYAVVTMGNNGDETNYNFRADLIYDKGFTQNFGTYRYVAMMTDYKYVVQEGNIAVPEGAFISQKGNIKFDVGSLGQWHNKSNNQRTAEIETNIPNVRVWYWDMLGDFVNGGWVNTLDYHVFDEGVKFQFKIADLKVSDVPEGETVAAPQYKVYWIGFFNNVTEIKGMIAKTEAAVAGESTPAE